jgi:phosphopantetheine adenylyltransferase
MKRSASIRHFRSVPAAIADLVRRASSIFERVVVAIAGNTHKEPMFNLEQRSTWLAGSSRRAWRRGRELPRAHRRVRPQNKINVIVRGLRAVSVSSSSSSSPT